MAFVKFRLNYILNKLDPKSFHLTNLLLHAVCSTLSLVIFTTLLGENRPRLSFIAAVIFSVHPVHTEAVSRQRHLVDYPLSVDNMIAFNYMFSGGRDCW